jgi:hypothetical protein
VGNEHQKDAIASRIDILMDARTTTVGYKSIINGGDVHDNCTKRDIIKLNDKCLYLISALNTALTFFPEKNWRDCCNEYSKICSVLTTPYSGRTVEDWQTTFHEKNSFPHPCSEEAAFKQSTARLPPILRDNDDLRQNFVRFCALHLTDLSIDLAREYVCDTLIPDFFLHHLPYMTTIKRVIKKG